jgi:hypothetical protein
MGEILPIRIVTVKDGLKEKTTSYFAQENSEAAKAKSVKDPFYQLEGFQLFAYFTANIIKEEVTFTR